MYCMGVGVGVGKFFLGKGFVGLRSGGAPGTVLFEFLWCEKRVEEASPDEEPDSTDSASVTSSSAC